MKTLKEQYPHLITEQPKRGTLVAKNIRLHLKHVFKNTKFSVKHDHSLNIKWTDGPSEGQVKSALACFNDSDFDTMTDYFGSKSTDFTRVFGGESFIFYHQELSDDRVKLILDRLNDRKTENQHITFEQYKSNGLNRLDHYIDGADSYTAEHHFYSDFKEISDAISDNYIAESEVYKNIEKLIINDISGLAKKAIENKVSNYMIENYLYYSQPNVYIEIEHFTDICLRLSDDIQEAIDKANGIETKKEKETRLANEYNAKVQKTIDSIVPVSIEMLEKHVDVEVKMPALNKNCTLHENRKCIDEESYIQTYELYKIITLNSSDYNFVSDNLLEDMHGLWGEYPKDYYSSETEAHWPVIQVICDGDANQNFIVDTQGFKYARYVGEVVHKPQTKLQITKQTNKPFNNIVDFMEYKKDNTAATLH